VKVEAGEAQKLALHIRPMGVVLGLVLLGTGLYALFSFIPAHDARALDIGDRSKSLNALTSSAWYFKAEYVTAVTAAAWGVVALGLLQLLTGSTKARGRIAFCKSCAKRVVSQRAFVGWKCERCRSRVKP